MQQLSENHPVIGLFMDCVSDGLFWLFTHPGSHLPIGSMRNACAGIEIPGQLIGLVEWELRYID